MPNVPNYRLRRAKVLLQDPIGIDKLTLVPF